MPQDLWTIAVGREVITSEQARMLIKIQKEVKDEAGFKLSLVHLLWAGGTALILTALALLGAKIGEDSLLSLAWLLTAYAAGFAVFARRLAGQREKPRILWGCLGAAAVILIASASFFFQLAFLDTKDLLWVNPIFDVASPVDTNDNPIIPSVWEGFVASGVILGFFSAVVSIWYLRRSSFLPIWVIISMALFCINYEVIRLVFPELALNNIQLVISTLTFGVVMLAVSLFQDQKATMNHGFWVNKAGWIAFSVGMGRLYDWSASWEVFFAFVCIVAALYSVYIRRPGGVTFAAMGLFGFLADNITRLFPGIWGGILVCTAIGACLIGLGMIIFRYQEKIENLLPKSMQAARPMPREDPVTFGF